MDEIRVTARLGRKNYGPYAVLPGAPVVIGRSAEQGLGLEGEWAPRVLATLVPSSDCWLLRNGQSTRMGVSNEWLEVTVPTDAVIALPAGPTLVRWPSLRETFLLRINVGGDIDDTMPVLGAEQGDIEEMRVRHVGTVWADELEADLLEPQQRRSMAVLFRYLLEGTPRPQAMFKTAANELGVTDDALKKQTLRVRRRINNVRFQNLRDTEALGEYLVERAALVTKADLPTSSGLSSKLATARQKRGQRPSPGDASRSAHE